MQELCSPALRRHCSAKNRRKPARYSAGPRSRGTPRFVPPHRAGPGRHGADEHESRNRRPAVLQHRREFIAKWRRDGVKTRTINSALEVVQRILRLAATEWIDERVLTWLEATPTIELLPAHDARPAYPLSAQEQSLLLKRLPDHLAKMALFKVDTGCREQPVGFRKVRVHDLEHTFERRLRAAGVSFEDRQNLLGHKSSRITTHYSQAELWNLIDAANRVCETERHKTSPTTWPKRKSG